MRHLAHVMIALLPSLSAGAAELKQETLNAWDDYVRTANARMQDRVHAEQPFLWLDGNSERLRRVRAGEVAVAPATDHSPRRVPSGLIHHWIGAAFLPEARMEDVTSVLRDYGRYKDYFRPHVLDSRLIQKEIAQDRFSLVLENKAVLLATALDSDYQSQFFQLDAKRAYSISQTTRIQEIQNPGRLSERKLPPDQGSGYIWRLYSITRFEARDGGVYLEVEAMALSRDIPPAVRWVVDPIVRRVSRSAVMTSLRQTQEAVCSTLPPAQAAR